MRVPRVHAFSESYRAFIFVFGILLVACDAMARGDLGGRFILTYQDGQTAEATQEAFLQHYEATLRDRLLKTNDLRISLILDDRKNLVDNLTTRRYRGQLDLRHRYYLFTATLAPKQKTTPLQLDTSRELAESALALRVAVPRLPQLRVSYTNSLNYIDGLYAGRSRTLRGDLGYTYKVLTLGINRWYAKDGSDVTKNTNVTGGRIGVAKSWGNYLSVRSAYDGQLTETTIGGLPERQTTNQVLTATLRATRRDLVTGTFSTSIRRFDADDVVALSNRNDQYTSRVLFFPPRSIQLEFGHNYSRQKQDGFGTLLNYATIQINARTPNNPRWSGSAQLSRRVAIESTGRTIPPNVLYLTGRSRVFEKVDARADFSVSQQMSGVGNVNRYGSSSRLELILRVRTNLAVQPRIEYFNVMDHLTLFKNERVDYRIKANYYARKSVTMSGEWRRTVLTVGTQQQNTAFSLNLNAKMRNRSTLTLSLGVNEIVEKAPVEDFTVSVGPVQRATTVSGQWQMWLTRRGSFVAILTHVDRNLGPETSLLSVSYRQDF